MEEIIIKIKKSDSKGVGFPIEVNCLFGEYRLIINRALEQKIKALDENFESDQLPNNIQDINIIGQSLYNALFVGEKRYNTDNTDICNLCGQYLSRGDLRISLDIDHKATLWTNYSIANFPWRL